MHARVQQFSWLGFLSVLLPNTAMQDETQAYTMPEQYEVVAELGPSPASVVTPSPAMHPAPDFTPEKVMFSAVQLKLFTCRILS